MDLSIDNTLSWTQPQGRWQSRGADISCLRLAFGIPPMDVSERIIDKDGHTLWHYWAHGPAPHELMEHLRAVDGEEYRNALSRDGEHPLHRLTAGGKHQALLAWEQAYGNKAWTQARNRHGDNLMASAMWAGHEPTALWAISRSVGDLDNADHAGLTCLMVAVHRCTEKTLEALLAAGADPGLIDAHGRSALHHAASRGLEDMFVLLEDAGCDPDEKDKAGASANALLARASKSESLVVLEQHWKKRANSRLDF